MNDQDLLSVIHDLNASRYHLEAAIRMLKGAQVPEEVHALHKSIMEKITNAQKIIVREKPKMTDGEKSI